MPSKKDPPKRIKAFKPKTKTGCKTCRIRRIKCDEFRPSCGQCKRGYRKCDFSAEPSTTTIICTSTSPSVTSSPPCEEQNFPVVSPSLISALFKTDNERRYFDFFINRTAPQLAGAFYSSFWSQFLLQATHHEPAIRHATLALGALHSSYEKNQTNPLGENARMAEKEFALSHYVKAMGSLVSPKNDADCNKSIDVALMACLLFICFETLRGYHGAALSHTDAGAKIICEVQSKALTGLNSSITSYVSITELSLLFSRLDTQASVITTARPRHLLYHYLTEEGTGYGCKAIPPCFESLEQASDFLDHFRISAMRVTKNFSKSPKSIHEWEEIKFALNLMKNLSTGRMKQWSQSFDNFVRLQKPRMSEQERRALHLLKLQRAFMSIHFSIDVVKATEDEMVWDEVTSYCADVVAHARALVDPNGEGRICGTVRPVFTLDTEVILPLYCIAGKCRDGRIRREAIEVMNMGDRQEGIWNGRLTARVSQRMMEIEEEGIIGSGKNGAILSVDVPREKRILGVEVQFEVEKKRANLRYRKSIIDRGGIADGIDEWVEW